MKKKVLRLISTGLLIAAQLTVADTVELSSLGQLQLSFKPVQSVTSVSGKKLVASVTNKVGEAYVLSTPTNVQQIVYLVENGELVKKGQIIATMKGPEVHHFVSEFQAYKSLYQLTKKRLENSRSLFQKKIIDEDKWLQINKNYQTTFLTYEHMRHFYELITEMSETDESVQLRSPVDGIIVKPRNKFRLNEADAIADFVSTKTILLEIKVPVNKSKKLFKVSTSSCELAITNKSKVADGAFINVWSETLTDNCELVFGQQIMIVPHYTQKAYKIPKSAVFNHNGNDSILVKQGQQLKPVEVTLLTSDSENYLVNSENDLSQNSILVTSVSAVQGVLLGLGGE